MDFWTEVLAIVVGLGAFEVAKHAASWAWGLLKWLSMRRRTWRPASTIVSFDMGVRGSDGGGGGEGCLLVVFIVLVLLLVAVTRDPKEFADGVREIRKAFIEDVDKGGDK